MRAGRTSGWRSPSLATLLGIPPDAGAARASEAAASLGGDAGSRGGIIMVEVERDTVHAHTAVYAMMPRGVTDC